MKIGVWIDGPINKNSGGSFAYVSTLIDGIISFKFTDEIEIVFVSVKNKLSTTKPSIDLAGHIKGISFFAKLYRKGLKILSETIFKNIIDAIDQGEKKVKDASAATYLKGQGIRLMFYPHPSATVIYGIPFILNNWDLAHYATYAFPEIIDNNGFNHRNHWYSTTMVNALMIFCETEAGKKELVRYLNINPDKIKILPIFPYGSLISTSLPSEEQSAILSGLNLERQKFFFYPAQFWAHKNHYSLVKAFKLFSLQYPDFKLLLCGSDNGNLAYIKNQVQLLKLEEKVIFTGFVDDNTLYTLYKNAIALVMPTIFGPSNMPPLEGMFLECPVLCSNIEGHMEMLGNAALYFDPLDDSSILESLQKIMDNSTRDELLRNQQISSKTSPHIIDRALLKLEENLLDAVKIRNTWE